MRSLLKILKRKRVICAIIALPMIMFFLFGILNINGESSGQYFKAALSSDPFDGRGSNTISGTGFNESKAGSIGAALSEPPTGWTTTWIDYCGFNAYTSLTTAGVTNLFDNVSAANGNFRKKDYTAISNKYNSNDDAGKTADTPWVISSEREFAFWARMIQLENSTASTFTAYVEKPYFKLGANIDLAGYRWIAPHFAYPTTDIISNTVNRIYFDGGGFAIKNAYVNQTESSSSSLYTASPSIFGNIPQKSVIKNVNIENAFITVPNKDSTNEVSIISQSTGTESVFENMSITNSVLRGYRGMNGIATNAALIKDCTLKNTTFISTPTASTQVKGFGVAAEFNGNKLINAKLEVIDAENYVFLTGIGHIRVISGYARSGEQGVWTTETGQEINGGFFDNTVENSIIKVAGGNYYAYALGIGYVSVAAPATFKGNTVKNSYIGIKTENDIAATTMRAHGIGYIGAGEQDIQISDNAVISSTVSIITRQHTSYASGMFNINVDRGAKIERCYTENTDVIAKVTGSTGSAYAYIAGISIGFANKFKDCIVGSGNIEARVAGGYIYAYGIGSTFGIGSTAGTTNRKNWTNDAANIDGWWNIENQAKGGYLGDIPVTEFINCYNFSNITTQSTSIIHAAGIGMGEGFTNCVNYGNIVGNQIGGIAYGFADNTDNPPGDAEGNSLTRTGALHPLIINNCANFGNMIRAANNQTSYIGGIFSRYEYSRNYRKVRETNNGMINVIDNIDGKHLAVINCISGGRFYFYRPIETGGETIYELTDQFDKISHTSNYWGVIFGSLNLRAYMFQESTTELNDKEIDEFDEFINERFIITNNYYNEKNAFDFMKLITSGTKNSAGADGNLSGLDHILNIPASNWRQTIYGATISNLSVRTKYADIGISSAMTGPGAFNVWSAIVRNWNDNGLIGFEKYDEIESDVWNTDSGVPQIALTEYPFHILAYDRNTATQGYVPNVSIKKIDDLTSFTIEEFQNIEVGVTIEEWYDRANDIAYAINSEAPNTQTLVLGGILPITMLFADNKPTVYNVDYESTPNYEYNPNTQTVKKGESIGVTVTYTTDGNVTGVIWSAYINGGWREILTNTDVVEIEVDKYTHTFSIEVTEWFILNFADGNNFRIKAEFVVDEIVLISFEVEDIIDTDIDTISNASLSVNLAVYNKDTVLKIMEGTEITLTAIYDKDLYDFENFIISGDESIYPKTSPLMITVETGITNISFSLKPKEYDIIIQNFSLASGGRKVQLDNDELVETKNDSLIKKAYIGARIDNLEAKDFYEDVRSESFYRFERWEFKTGAFISGEINSGEIILTPKLFKEGNLQDTEDGRVFIVAAVFQRQVKLVVNMKNDLGYEGNTYRVFQGKSEREILDFGGHQGVIVDENILVRIEFYADSRLEIYEIDGIKATEHDDYRDKVFYITINTLTQLEVTLVPRDATVWLLNHKAHDDSNVTSYGGLGVVVLEGDSLLINKAVKYNGEFIIAINRDINVNLYRFIDLKIRNVITNKLDSIEHLFLGSGALTVTADEGFFYNYVSTDGECEILLLVAVVYEVKISAANFTRQNGTNGTYIYTDAFGNSFALEFIKGKPDNIIVEHEPGSNNFIIDHGVKIVYTLNGEFETYYSVNAGESEKENKTIIITSTREIAFLANQYSLVINKTGSNDASIESYNENFGIGSVITIPFNVKSAFQIKEIRINGKTLSELGIAESKGNTLIITVTPEFIRAVNAGLDPNVELNMDIKTGLSSLILFGSVGGGVALLAAAFLIVFLSLRSKRINEKRKAAEALAREYEQRFNIGNLIEDLKKTDE